MSPRVRGTETMRGNVVVPREDGDPCAFLFELRFRLSSGLVVIRAWDANHTDPRTGHVRIDCELSQVAWARGFGLEDKRIFRRGDTWCAVNQWTSIDGIEAKELVGSLFAMRPGDTDADYFSSYTAEQLAWAEANGEELGMLVHDRYCDPETGAVRSKR